MRPCLANCIQLYNYLFGRSDTLRSKHSYTEGLRHVSGKGLLLGSLISPLSIYKKLATPSLSIAAATNYFSNPSLLALNYF